MSPSLAFSLHGSAVEASLVAAGFGTRSQIIWDKGRLIISRGHYHWRHEPCCVRGAEGQDRQLDRRSQADDDLASAASSVRDGACDAEAAGMHGGGRC